MYNTVLMADRTKQRLHTFLSFFLFFDYVVARTRTCASFDYHLEIGEINRRAAMKTLN